MMFFRFVKFLILFFFLSAFSLKSVCAASVTQLSVAGAIGPATADYLVRGIEEAQDSAFILIALDTPGGLVKSTRQIVQAILNSHVPIVTYVSPKGARAASAGTFLLYASTVAVMAPGTHLGAASPVGLGAGEKKANESQSTMEKKVMNDTLAYIRTLAQMRGRNVEFAQKAVSDAQTMTAQEALKAGVINVVARNRADLLNKLNGMEVTQDNQLITLMTKSASVREVAPDWRVRILLIITDPTIAYMLLLLGIYGIFFELMNPGFMVPGVIGAIALLVALYALQLLPVNYAGLALIFLGVGFVVAESFAPSFGILGLGGTVAFVVGSVFLLDTHVAMYQIAWSAIWAMAVVNVVFFITLFSMMFRARRKPVEHGLQAMLGTEGRALTVISQEGQALIRGEIWSVHAGQVVAAGKTVRVVAVDGLSLAVEEIIIDSKEGV